MQRDKGGRTIVGKLAQAGEYVGCIVLFYWLHMDTEGGKGGGTVVVRQMLRFVGPSL